MDIKVVIADDEPLLLKSIITSIQNSNENFKVIAQATDGQTALKLISELSPDLVFVDIRMPVMDGLSVIKKLRESNNTVPIVILSGYQEFEYAKKAIKLDVLDYLLKPIDQKVLNDLLNNFYDSFVQNRQKEQQEALESLLHGQKRGKASAQPDLFNVNYKYVNFLICFGNYSTYRYNQLLPEYSVDKLVNQDILADIKMPNILNSWILHGKCSNERILVLAFNQNIQLNVTSIGMLLFKNLLKRSEQICKVSMFAGTPFQSIDDFPMKIIDLEYQMEQNLVYCKSTLIFGNGQSAKMKTDNIYNDLSIANKLMANRKMSEVSILMKNILDSCEKNSCTQFDLEKIIQKAFLIILGQIPQNDFDFSDLDLIVCNSKSYKELYENLRVLFNDIATPTSLSVQENTEQIVNRIETYLIENYSQHISLQEISDKFSFNYSYISSVFKKYKNISPNEYIINMRVKKATELLKTDSNFTIRQIANIVGYDDPYYFSRIFKSTTGKSPSEIRKII